MPSPIVQSFAKETGKSVDEVEKLWKDTEEIVKKQYPDKKDDDFYALVVGILKKRLKIKEEADPLTRKAEMDKKRFINSEIKELKNKMRTSKDPLEKRAMMSKIKLYQKKLKGPIVEPVVDEEAQAGITTASIGADAYHQSKAMPMVSRRGVYKDKKKKKYESYLDSKIK